MSKETTKKALLQANNGDCEPLLREYMRHQIRESLWDLMQEEVEGLCGAKYQPEPGGNIGGPAASEGWPSSEADAGRWYGHE